MNSLCYVGVAHPRVTVNTYYTLVSVTPTCHGQCLLYTRFSHTRVSRSMLTIHSFQSHWVIRPSRPAWKEWLGSSVIEQTWVQIPVMTGLLWWGWAPHNNPKASLMLLRGWALLLSWFWCSMLNCNWWERRTCGVTASPWHHRLII